MKMKGSQAIVASLEAEGCEVLFGFPGGMVIPIYDALLDAKQPTDVQRTAVVAGKPGPDRHERRQLGACAQERPSVARNANPLCPAPRSILQR